MTGAFPVVVVLALIAVLGALGLGLFSMARGGEFNRKYGNLFMRWRVALQATAIVLFVILVLTLGR